MNGDDLRTLAQRSMALEDRSHDRLDEVHARIAVARRRRRSTAALASAAVVLVGLAVTLVVVNADPDGDKPEPAPSPDPSLSVDPSLAPGSAKHRPAEGTCWAVPPQSVVDQSHWYDDSPQVPCGEPHTTETVAVLALSEPTPDEAQKRAVDLCWEEVRLYVGIDARNWIPWGAAAFLPSQAQIDDGASWIRCDATFPNDTAFEHVRTTTGSAAGIAGDPPPDHWACIDQPPETVDQPLVPCDRPHRYEQTGRVALLIGQDEYPTRQEREDASVQCEAGVPTRLQGFDIGIAWDPPSGFEPSDDVSGICYVYDPSGDPLPARPSDEGARP